MQTMKVKKGDIVHVLSGKDRGKQGRVIEARPSEGRVVVENINLVTRHQRPRPLPNASRMGGTQMSEGGRIQRPAPLPVDNVMVVCPTCKRPTRIGTVVKQVKDSTIRVRVCKRADCLQEIDR
jgi:large subunit ribosomal protein L24